MMEAVRPHFAQVTCLLVGFACWFPSPGLAQGARYEGRTIATIQFVPHEQPLDPAEINDLLPLKIRGTLRMADVQASIERLFATGRYKDIRDRKSVV